MGLEFGIHQQKSDFSARIYIFLLLTLYIFTVFKRTLEYPVQTHFFGHTHHRIKYTKRFRYEQSGAHILKMPHVRCAQPLRASSMQIRFVDFGGFFCISSVGVARRSFWCMTLGPISSWSCVFVGIWVYLVVFRGICGFYKYDLWIFWDFFWIS